MQGKEISSSWQSELHCTFTILVDQAQPRRSSQERSDLNTLTLAKRMIGPSQVELSGLLSRSTWIIGRSKRAVHC